ncbi:MAG TPA: hypothetical protein VG013_18170 [Gemmataceae bacterium]|nr:hypothetical protein [Gemmataceae bacterium]
MAASAMSARTFQGVQRLADQARIFLRRDPAPVPDSGSSLDAIEGVQACLRLRDYLRDSVKLAFDEAFSGQTEDYNATGVMCQLAFKAALMTFEAVRGDVDAASVAAVSEGIRRRFKHIIQSFRKAEADLKELQGQFEASWPWEDASLLARSIAGEGAERRRPAKVAFDEIRSRHRRKGD